MAVTRSDVAAAWLDVTGCGERDLRHRRLRRGPLIGWIGHRVLRRIGRQPGPAVRKTASTVLAVAASIVVIAGLVWWPIWQDDQRALVTLGSVSRWIVVPVFVVTIVLTFVLGMFGRLVWKGVTAVDRTLSRRFTRPVAIAGTVIVVTVVGWFVTIDVIWRGFVSWADDRFAALATTTAAGSCNRKATRSRAVPARSSTGTTSGWRAARSSPRRPPRRTCGPSMEPTPSCLPRSGCTPGGARANRSPSRPSWSSASSSAPAASTDRSCA